MDLLVAVRILVSVRTSNLASNIGWGTGNGGTANDTGRSLRINVRAGEPESVFDIEVVEAEKIFEH